MVRTQIQLPDEVYVRAKKLAAAREISMAELARRGLEYILDVYAADAGADWAPPTPQALGWKGMSDAALKDHAQLPPSEVGVRKASPRRRPRRSS